MQLVVSNWPIVKQQPLAVDEHTSAALLHLPPKDYTPQGVEDYRRRRAEEYMTRLRRRMGEAPPAPLLKAPPKWMSVYMATQGTAPAGAPAAIADAPAVAGGADSAAVQPLQPLVHLTLLPLQPLQPLLHPSRVLLRPRLTGRRPRYQVHRRRLWPR